MDGFFGGVQVFSDFIWGGTWGDQRILPVGIVAIALLGSGVYLMVATGFHPLRRLIPAFGGLWSGRKSAGEGEITPWQALSTALSGQVGTGNLAGVATAITLGGPGAIFWMWVTALFGMALAFAESSLAVRYRERHPDGHFHGGPMYYIKNGLGGGPWMILAFLFCLGTLFSATATGGMIQANSVTQSVIEAGNSVGMAIPNWAVGLGIAALVFIVIIGGIKSIGSVAGKIVPAMAGAYVLAAAAVLVMNAPEIPGALWLIISSAFGLQEAVGGLAGYGVLAAIRAGVARGLFSNEAGQGSAPIAHAAAKTNDPVKQGEIAMLGVFIDTIIICTMTALVILTVSGEFASGSETVRYAWQSADLEASAITTAAFGAGMPGGQWVVLAAQALFAFTTIIGWSYYAEQCLTFITGDWAAKPFRFVWVGVAFLGALIVDVDGLWRLGDVANASMLFPNVIAVMMLSGVVLAMSKAGVGAIDLHKPEYGGEGGTEFDPK